MKCIFAPWRMEYILSEKPQHCIFCELPKKGVSPETLILYMDERGFVIINRYPYVSGHVMVVPYKHVETPLALSEREWEDLNALVLPAVRAIEKVYRPEGFNIGLNVGQPAGAGIHEHIHIHIVPRWQGDTNLMSVFSDTRVIPESLEETWRRLRPAFEKLEARR